MTNHIEDLGAALHSRIAFMSKNLNVDQMEFIGLVYAELGVEGPPPAHWHEKLRPDFWDSEIMEAASTVCTGILRECRIGAR